ncbi:TPA: hypothetical protein QDZ99_003588 [Stenotrophomonas maltophilia]|nr:hypothetical protein [Stenotrophomonas maltophilia]HDS1158295.1 hypothetical protein [Stenotrophomonas maltophilia]HDS1167169.1 hypothetical protein [Stenotrophomonas maltophilia]HDS1171845.1 hypothetical protein [Stenotrophomonas maltophilia]HDS1176506.1 hypothetical protein [Stenotrophomonas maltophilia]
MSNDNKTLADAQPGGRVRLGDQGERARFKAWWDAARPLEGSAFPYEIAWSAWQAALSSQSSPGGQGDALVAGWRERADKHELNALEADSIGDMTATVQELETKCEVLRQVAGELEAALAARQPVGEPFAYGSSAGHQPIPASVYYPDNAACRELYDIPLYASPQQSAQAVDLGRIINQIAEQWDGCCYDAVGETIDIGQAIRAAGMRLAMTDSQAVGEPVAEVLSFRVGNDTSTVDKALPAGTKLYTTPTAQAVDLGRWSQRHADDLHVAVHTALSVHASSLSQKKRAFISAHVKRLLIDSQAVGNG